MKENDGDDNDDENENDVANQPDGSEDQQVW